MKDHLHLTLLAVLLAMVGSTLFSPMTRAASHAAAVVNTPALNVRQGPGTTYAVIDVRHQGDSLEVTGQNSAAGWYRVNLSDGRSGWVAGSFVDVDEAAGALPEVAASAVAPASSTSPGSVIVFQVSSGGAIYALDLHGPSLSVTNLRYLTTGMDPALSPDGRTVAFTRWLGQTSGVGGSLWTINVDGSGERQVMATGNQPKSPTWSADGRRIVVNIQQGGTLGDKWTCMVDGQPVEVAEPIEGQRCMPQRADPHWGLRVVDVANGTYQDLSGSTHSFGPTWDPANAWHVVYRGDLGLMNLDIIQSNTWLLQSGGAQRGPVFSPNGQKLATTFKQNDHWEVHVLNADGSGEVRLTETPMSIILEDELQGKDPHPWNNVAPAWSPDGSQIAFLSDRNGTYEIWVMNADGSGQRLLLPAQSLAGQEFKYDGADERVISWR